MRETNRLTKRRSHDIFMYIRSPPPLFLRLLFLFFILYLFKDSFTLNKSVWMRNAHYLHWNQPRQSRRPVVGHDQRLRPVEKFRHERHVLHISHIFLPFITSGRSIFDDMWDTPILFIPGASPFIYSWSVTFYSFLGLLLLLYSSIFLSWSTHPFIIIIIYKHSMICFAHVFLPSCLVPDLSSFLLLLKACMDLRRRFH